MSSKFIILMAVVCLFGQSVFAQGPVQFGYQTSHAMAAAASATQTQHAAQTQAAHASAAAQALAQAQARAAAQAAQAAQAAAARRRLIGPGGLFINYLRYLGVPMDDFELEGFEGYDDLELFDHFDKRRR